MVNIVKILQNNPFGRRYTADNTISILQMLAGSKLQYELSNLVGWYIGMSIQILFNYSQLRATMPRYVLNLLFADMSHKSVIIMWKLIYIIIINVLNILY